MAHPRASVSGHPSLAPYATGHRRQGAYLHRPSNRCGSAGAGHPGHRRRNLPWSGLRLSSVRPGLRPTRPALSRTTSGQRLFG